MRILFFLLLPLFCFCQEDDYSKLNKLSKVEFEKSVADSIVKLESGDLWNFLKVLKDDYKKDLKPFNENFIKKMEATKWPMDMHFLLKFLIEQKTDKAIIENILNSKKAVWDNGQWSGKFWKVIRENKLNVSEDSNYLINEKGEKSYDVKSFLEEKIKNGVIGPNPLLYLDYTLTDYEPNQLFETLEKMNIKDIQIISKEEAPKMYGKRGADGMIKVLRR
ncbi:hypothetical protein [Flavobacterium sp.]|uniref:hypothetical protein n=1 Tax=Flavobacterium sp. TaxID=239 RepID=UPI00391B2FB7